MHNPYAILGVGKNATDGEIRAAFRRRAKETHPDMFNGSKEAEERFKEVVIAYNILSNPVSRRAYDTSGFDEDKWDWQWENYFEKVWTCPVCGAEGNTGSICDSCGTSDFFRARRDYEEAEKKRQEKERIRMENEEAERKRTERENLIRSMDLYSICDDHGTKIMQVRAESENDAIKLAKNHLGNNISLSALAPSRDKSIGKMFIISIFFIGLIIIFGILVGTGLVHPGNNADATHLDFKAIGARELAKEVPNIYYGEKYKIKGRITTILSQRANQVSFTIEPYGHTLNKIPFIYIYSDSPDVIGKFQGFYPNDEITIFGVNEGVIAHIQIDFYAVDIE